MKWMPIDTAPKNGKPILAVINYDGCDLDERQVDIIEWDEEELDWYSSNGGWLKKIYMHAIHWMDLPELPPKS